MDIEYVRKLREKLSVMRDLEIPIVIKPDVLIGLCEALELRFKGLPDAGAPREGPCWCNGPYADENRHHDFCKSRRKAWFTFLKAREQKV